MSEVTNSNKIKTQQSYKNIKLLKPIFNPEMLNSDNKKYRNGKKEMLWKTKWWIRDINVNSSPGTRIERKN